jgi:transposase
MLFGFNGKIWLYRQPVDFRKQIDGLVYLIVEDLAKDPTSGQLFVFRNRLSSRIKLLWWDRNGFWLMYKRLEKGRFRFPLSGDTVWLLTKDELGWLLSGLDFTAQKKPCKVIAKNFM